MTVAEAEAALAAAEQALRTPRPVLMLPGMSGIKSTMSYQRHGQPCTTPSGQHDNA